MLLIVLVFCVVFLVLFVFILCHVCQMLSVYLDCPFLITLVFSNVYLTKKTGCDMLIVFKLSVEGRGKQKN